MAVLKSIFIHTSITIQVETSQIFCFPSVLINYMYFVTGRASTRK